MEFVEIVKFIPIEARETIIEKMIDLILDSKKGENMPSELAKTILYYWQRNQLTSDIGMEKLLEAAILLESEAIFSLLGEELGLQDVVEKLKAKQS